MARKSSNNSAPVAVQHSPEEYLKGFELPEGYLDQSDDIIGVWDPETGPIHVVPLNAALSDSKIDASKPSTLIFCTLVKDAVVFTKNKESDETESVQGKAGDRIGIWAKPGMAKLRDLANIPTVIVETGAKNTGKGNPMKTYKTFAKTTSQTPLQVIADRRDKSKSQPTFLTRDLAVVSQSSGKPVDEDAPAF